MTIICANCMKAVPDSFHDFDEECECQDWKAEAKKRGWIIRTKGKKYNFEKELKSMDDNL